MTNREFARSNPLFKKACELAGIEEDKITARQASKFRNEKGRAFKFKATAQRAVES